jgi:hypothetical protein
MAKITLTDPLTRNAIVPTADENTVEISYPLWVDDDNQKASFRYSTGHIDSVFVPDFTSDLVTISGADYTTYLLANPPTPGSSLIFNLEKQLLQYLIDKSIVGPGTITA